MITEWAVEQEEAAMTARERESWSPLCEHPSRSYSCGFLPHGTPPHVPRRFRVEVSPRTFPELDACSYPYFLLGFFPYKSPQETLRCTVF